MPYFKDADEVYAHLGKLFQDIIADEQLGSELQRIDTIVQYRLRNPDAQVTLKAIADGERAVELGPTQTEPEVVITMSADTAHRFWLGGVNVTVALARGQMMARGPVAKILKLVTLAKPVIERYRSQLQAAGREDLTQV
jgi:SCP-2 sterol transfer family protein